MKDEKTALKKLVVGMVMLNLFPSLLHASGYEFEGIGARQVSRAGAATADADDWSTFYWNPARMVENANDVSPHKEFGIELFGGQAYAKDSNSLSNLPGIGTTFNFSKSKMDSAFLLGSLGIVVPAGEKWAFGGGFYTPLLQGLDFTDSSDSPVPNSHIHYKASAGILVWNVSASRRLTPKVTVGSGINLLYGKIESDTNLQSAGGNLEGHLEGDGTGLEGVFSVNVKPTERWDVGAIVRTGGDVKIKGTATAKSAPFDESSGFRFSLRQPPTSSLGLAFKASERTTWTMDFAQTYWHRFSGEIQYDNQGILQRNLPNTFNWRDTWKLKVGSKFVLNQSNQLYVGYSYDRPTLDPGSLDFSTTVDVPMHRLALGESYRWNSKFESTIGAIVGRGTRHEDNADYELKGWQVMAETRFTY